MRWLGRLCPELVWILFEESKKSRNEDLTGTVAVEVERCVGREGNLVEMNSSKLRIPEKENGTCRAKSEL